MHFYLSIYLAMYMYIGALAGAVGYFWRLVAGGAVLYIDLAVYLYLTQSISTYLSTYLYVHWRPGWSRGRWVRVPRRWGCHAIYRSSGLTISISIYIYLPIHLSICTLAPWLEPWSVGSRASSLAVPCYI